MTGTQPHIAVVIPTRDRPASAARATASVLAQDYPSFSVWVVDQSSDPSTVRALEPYAGDPRLHVMTSRSCGVGAARNRGVEASDAPILAFTDDDCEAEAGWLEGIHTVFAQNPAIATIFGTVRSADYDRTAGFIPAYYVRRDRSVHGVSRKHLIEGIGACMAIRRSAWNVLGGFDEWLGTGAPFLAGEDTDFAMRTLWAGLGVHETADVAVKHLGFRSFGESTQLIEGYMFGLGVVNAKMVRLGGVRALRPIAALAWRWAARGPVVDLNHRPPRLMRLRAFSRGVRQALRIPLGSDGRFGRPSGSTW